MVQSHWILWIWESLALMEVKLSQIFDYHFSWVIIYFKFEGENEKKEKIMLITKTRFNMVFTIHAEVILTLEIKSRSSINHIQT